MYSPVRARSSCPTQNYGSTVKKVKKSENLGLHEILTTLNRFHRMLNFSSDPTTSGHPLLTCSLQLVFSPTRPPVSCKQDPHPAHASGIFAPVPCTPPVLQHQNTVTPLCPWLRLQGQVPGPDLLHPGHKGLASANADALLAVVVVVVVVVVVAAVVAVVAVVVVAVVVVAVVLVVVAVAVVVLLLLLLLFLQLVVWR